MNMISDTFNPEAVKAPANQVASRKAASPRELILTWLIVVASLIVAIQVFRTVALQLEVNRSLDQLYEEAGQPLPAKS